MAKNGKPVSTDTPTTKKPLTPEQAAASAAGRDAWKAEHDATVVHVAPLSAVTLRRIREMQATGLTRGQIADEFETSSGALSRHMTVVKYAETALPQPINGTMYNGAIEALEAGAATLNSLYAMLAPAPTNRGGKTLTLRQALTSVIKRHIRYRNARESRTLTILESRADWLAAVRFLLEHKTGGLLPSTIEALVDSIPRKPENEKPASVAPEARKAA